MMQHTKKRLEAIENRLNEADETPPDALSVSIFETGRELASLTGAELVKMAEQLGIFAEDVQTLGRCYSPKRKVKQ